jgi:hypothetical protein
VGEVMVIGEARVEDYVVASYSCTMVLLSFFLRQQMDRAQSDNLSDTGLRAGSRRQVAFCVVQVPTGSTTATMMIDRSIIERKPLIHPSCLLVSIPVSHMMIYHFSVCLRDLSYQLCLQWDQRQRTSWSWSR